MAWWSWLGGQRFRSRSRGETDGLTTATLSDLFATTVATSEAAPVDQLTRAGDLAGFEVPQQRVPDGAVRPLSMRRIRESLDRLEIRYLTDTVQGSSGSPVLDDNWQIVALHHGYKRVDPKPYAAEPGISGIVKFHNQGIDIQAIMADLPAAAADEIKQVQGWT